MTAPIGKVFTFYSYKGGTGRSMVLANVAWILASNGKRVLVIDWDLEAPGLHRYFHPFLKDPELRSCHGLIDFVVDYEMKFQELGHEAAEKKGDAEPEAQGKIAIPPVFVVDDVPALALPVQVDSADAGAPLQAPSVQVDASADDVPAQAQFVPVDASADDVPAQAQPVPVDASADNVPAQAQSVQVDRVVETDVAGEAAEPARGGVVGHEEPAIPERWAALVRAQVANVHLYIQPLRAEIPREGEIDFLPAGLQGPGYATRVNSFDWAGLYEKRYGWELFEGVKEELRREYDYVLVDSRTGVSDTSGICTVQLPDALVACFTLNNQGIDGASSVASFVHEQRPDIEVFPVPMRVESSEKEKADRRKAFAQERFSRFPVSTLGGEGRERYWGEVSFPYVPFYAYEEVLAVFGDKPGEAASLLAAAERLSGYLTAGDVPALVPSSEEERQRIVHLYARNSAPAQQSLTPEQRASRAEEAVAKMDAEQAGAVYRVFTRLVQLSREGADTWSPLPLVGFDADEQAAIRKLDGTALTVKTDEASKAEVVHIAHPAVGEAWERLRKWVREDRDFLLWRRRLATSITEWEDNDRDASALLSGGRLRAATRHAQENAERLTPVEEAYIRASGRAYRHQRAVRAAAGAVIALLLAFVIGGAWRAAQNQEQALQEQAIVQRAYQDSLLSLRAGALSAIGEQNYQLGNYEGAIAAFDTSLALRPGDPGALLGRARAQHDRGDYTAAITDLTAVLQAQPQNADALLLRANARLAAGDTTSSLEDLTQIVNVSRDSVLRGQASERLQAVTEARGGIVVDSAVRVYVHFQARPDAERTRAVARELGRVGYRVEGVEFRGQVSPGGIVRYFHAADREQANFIARTVQRTLADADAPMDVSAVSLEGRYRAPRGQIEVWIPPLPSRRPAEKAPR
jgi:tetratricopeptide (TPR) repeat protein